MYSRFSLSECSFLKTGFGTKQQYSWIWSIFAWNSTHAWNTFPDPNVVFRLVFNFDSNAKWSLLSTKSSTTLFYFFLCMFILQKIRKWKFKKQRFESHYKTSKKCFENIIANCAKNISNNVNFNGYPTDSLYFKCICCGG